jgi:7,8-dihydropterin-6-yl-methyl-4-(beta-D-ribofuranosyl)aminobenzene 5'-phosphate synthase
MRSKVLSLLVLLVSGPAAQAISLPPKPQARVTILYDAFGGRAGLTRDWGFAALIEYGGRRILFDTGDNAAVFAHNVRALHVDLRRLDFAVISHRHGDHIAGLDYLLRVNPTVRIYAPRENFGIFGSTLPGSFYRRDAELPADMRYFNGAPDSVLHFGAAWPGAHFILVDTLTEVMPGVSLVSAVSTSPGTLELRELSLLIQTPAGALLVVGCSHPGIETILRSASAVTSDVSLIVGGLHWVTAPDSTIGRLVGALHDQYRVRQMAPGHCTGEPGFAALRRRYGSDYLKAGLGTVLEQAPDSTARWQPGPTRG